VYQLKLPFSGLHRLKVIAGITEYLNHSFFNSEKSEQALIGFVEIKKNANFKDKLSYVKQKHYALLLLNLSDCEQRKLPMLW